MLIRLDDEIVDFTDIDKEDGYINSGLEGDVFYYKGMALKIYHDLSYGKERLDEESCRKLQEIQTNHFLLPRKMVYDENNRFIGYCTLYIPPKPIKRIYNLSVDEFREKIKPLDDEMHYLASRKVKVSDLMMCNFIYNSGFYFIDPGEYRLLRDKPSEEIYVEGLSNLSKFVVWDILARSSSLTISQKQRLLAMYNEAGSYMPIIEEGKSSETIKEFVKRITS